MSKKQPEFDCFAFDKDKKSCKCLKKLYCVLEDKCSFYKHKAEVDLDAIENSVKNYFGVHKSEEGDDTNEE